MSDKKALKKKSKAETELAKLVRASDAAAIGQVQHVGL